MACSILCYLIVYQGFLGKNEAFGCVVEGWNMNERSGSINRHLSSCQAN